MNNTVLQKGDIVTWDNTATLTRFDARTRCRIESSETFVSVALMENAKDFSVCLNFKGCKDEQDKLYYNDSIPVGKDIRRAAPSDVISLMLALDKAGIPFRIDKMSLTNETGNVAVKEEEEEVRPEVRTMRTELAFPDDDMRKLSPERKFRRYLAEMVLLYKTDYNLRGASDIGRRFSVSKISKGDFYVTNLKAVTDCPEWLFTQDGTAYCVKLYTYAASASKTGIVPPAVSDAVIDKYRSL